MYAQVMGLGTIFENIGEKIRDLLSGFSVLSSIKDKIKINTRVVLIIAGALGVIIVLLLVLAIVTHKRTGSDTDASSYTEAPIQRERLPAEEYFLPYEPDFVPDVLLEREPRDTWTEEDARPFWTDPLEGNEDVWRKRIESGIDSLLEHVP